MTEVITINTKGPVPDHLHDTNIFCRFSSNSVVDVDPKEVHFCGYRLNESNLVEVKFTNISDEISRFHIIPPVSKYFRLRYNKPERMVPGSTVKCTVIFVPDKVRNYNDFIRVHTKDNNNNIIIPIFAYPAIKGLHVPRNIKFPLTPVGKICEKKLVLHSDSAFDFDYDIIVIKDNPAIVIEPLSGTIPANGDQIIHLRFSPMDYVTCEKTVKIYISQYNFKPVVCTISGSSQPGLERKLFMEEDEEAINEYVASTMESLSKLSKRKPIRLKSTSTDLSRVTTASVVSKQRSLIKQLKADFEARVRENVNVEKQNQLRWQTCRGFQPISEKEVEIIRKNRDTAMKEYQLKIRNESELAECYEFGLVDKSCWKKTFVNENRQSEIQENKIFTSQFVPECWTVRKFHLNRFRAAAWKIIVMSRFEKRFEKLKISGGVYEEIDNSHLVPGGENLSFRRPLDGLSETFLPVFQFANEGNFNLSEYKLNLPLRMMYDFQELVEPLQMHVLGYERVDTSNLYYVQQRSGYEFKMSSVSDKTFSTTEESGGFPNKFIDAHDTELISYDDRDWSLVPFQHSMHYFDKHSYLPLYFYENELFQQKKQVDMNWKVIKSPFLLCKKLIKSGLNDRLMETALDTDLLKVEVPRNMTKEDLQKLDYEKSGTASPLITTNIINDEFAVLSTFKATLEENWKKL